MSTHRVYYVFLHLWHRKLKIWNTVLGICFHFPVSAFNWKLKFRLERTFTIWKCPKLAFCFFIRLVKRALKS